MKLIFYIKSESATEGRQRVLVSTRLKIAIYHWIHCSSPERSLDLNDLQKHSSRFVGKRHFEKHARDQFAISSDVGAIILTVITARHHLWFDFFKGYCVLHLLPPKREKSNLRESCCDQMQSRKLKTAYVDRFSLLRHKNGVESWKTYKKYFCAGSRCVPTLHASVDRGHQRRKGKLDDGEGKKKKIIEMWEKL